MVVVLNFCPKNCFIRDFRHEYLLLSRFDGKNLLFHVNNGDGKVVILQDLLLMSYTLCSEEILKFDWHKIRISNWLFLLNGNLRKYVVRFLCINRVSRAEMILKIKFS